MQRGKVIIAFLVWSFGKIMKKSSQECWNGTNVTRKFGGFRLIDGENVNPLNQHQILRMVNLVIKAPDLNLTSWLAD